LEPDSPNGWAMRRATWMAAAAFAGRQPYKPPRVGIVPPLRQSASRHVPVTEEGFKGRLSNSRLVTYFDDQVLKYNEATLISTGALAAASTAASFLRKQGQTWFYAVASCLCALIIHRWAGCADALPPTLSESTATLLVNLLHSIRTVTVFLLGFFLSACLNRWWAMRNDGIGSLWGSMNDLSLLVASYFPRDDPEDGLVRERLLRWSVLSHELMYKQAMGDENLDDLVQCGLLEQDEQQVLQPLPSKGQVVWAWASSYIAHLAAGPVDQGGSRLPFPVTTMPAMQRLCCQARGAIGATLSYVDTQVPFRYMHALGLVVAMHNIMQAITSTVVIARALCKQNYITASVEVLCVVFFPTVFAGLLNVGAGMLNPLRSCSDTDFPRGAFSYFMLSENRGFHQGCLQLQNKWFSGSPSNKVASSSCGNLS